MAARQAKSLKIFAFENQSRLRQPAKGSAAFGVRKRAASSKQRPHFGFAPQALKTPGTSLAPASAAALTSRHFRALQRQTYMGRQALLVAASDLQKHKAPFANECQLRLLSGPATDSTLRLRPLFPSLPAMGVPSAALILYDAAHKVLKRS
jgi:hypothetical protein